MGAEVVVVDKGERGARLEGAAPAVGAGGAGGKWMSVLPLAPSDAIGALAPSSPPTLSESAPPAGTSSFHALSHPPGTCLPVDMR